MIKELLYSSPLKRTIMRIVEISIISAIVGVIDSGVWEALVPAGLIGVIAGILKGIREYLDKEKGE